MTLFGTVLALHIAAGALGLILGPVAMLTALLVVNWRTLTGTSGLSSPWPWMLPTLIGSPIIAWVNVQVRRGRRDRARWGA